MKIPRMYVDTSVLGGCFDEEFAEDSLALIDMARQGLGIVVVSDALSFELEGAPERVKAVLDDLPERCIERISSGPESNRLRDLYLEAGVVGPASKWDATHVALATIHRADMVVSWNFKHLVHRQKSRGFNAVNLREGYGPIEIISPKEIV